MQTGTPKTYEIVDTYKNTTAPPLLDQAVDYARKLKVVIIGTGFSGLATAYKLSQQLENIDLVVYEKNEDIGGTWFENRYPGVACDIPSHCYQYSFAENTEWSSFYVTGAEILTYLGNCAAKFDVRKFIKFKHELVKAEWSEPDGQWKLTLKHASTESESVVNDVADIVVSATGFLNHWEFPHVEGLEKFKGRLTHTAAWDLEPAGEAWRERTVAVIGCGSSATQVVPALQPHVKHLDNYVRGRTWISRPFSAPILARYPDAETNNHVFTEEEKSLYNKSPEAYRAFRLEMEDTMNSISTLVHDGSNLQELLRSVYEGKMRDKLKSRPDIAENLIPDFPLVCRRLTPGVGYLEALMSDNVDYIKSEIRRFTEEGIETADGEQRKYDVIVTATGFDTSFIPRFPILGRDGVNLQDAWAQHPNTYLGLCQDGFPNWFQIAGPNTVVAVGSFMVVVERQIDYVLGCIRKMQRQRIKSMVVKKAAVQDFQNYCDGYFPKTVFARKCRTWYKKGESDARVTALWPGSSLHQLRALEQPRFEDYTYTYTDDNESGSSLYWLGNGSTVAENEGKPLTRAWYLDAKA